MVFSFLSSLHCTSARFVLTTVSFCVVLTCLVPPAGAGEIAGETLETAMQSTVFLRVDRLFAGREVSTSGTGFLIDENGWILTNEHVVSETIPISSGTEYKEGRSKVTGVVAVVNSGTPEEAELDAKIIARNTDEDLALLKIEGRHGRALDIWGEGETKVTDEVWVVGYPFGELLAMERWQSSELANPVVSVNQGRISAFRRGTKGDVRMIQTDAAVNPGNSGGPLIGEDGTVLGVVTARVGSGGVGFAVSAARVRAFILTKGYKVRFQPAVVVHTTEVLVARLESGLIDLQSMKGSFSVGGGETPDTSSPFRWNGHVLEARVDLVPSSSSDAAEGLLRGRIDLSRDGGKPVSRVFRLNGKSSSRRVSSSRSSGDPTLTAGGGSEIDSSAGSKPLGLGGGKFGGARSTSGAGEPGVMISDEVMAEIQEYKFSEELYAELPEFSDRSLAEQYDRTSYELYRLLVKFNQRDRWNRDKSDRIRGEIESVLSEMSKMQSALRGQEICRCGSKWKLCSDTTCHKPEKPWLEDDLSEIRKAIKHN